MKIQTRLATLTVLLATTILPLTAQSDGVDKSIDTMLGDNAPGSWMRVAREFELVLHEAIAPSRG